ncbi:phenylalanine--tRNA ligase subunit alpha [Buchnera aphidicola (Taiwanaphis decaspermi)]|uniref:phenylalanine--tRNA ligase subunit alpha n=1 Tax=Buchnera aphidicola TaxID=9 RepID=UPI0031B86F2B
MKHINVTKNSEFKKIFFESYKNIDKANNIDELNNLKTKYLGKKSFLKMQLKKLPQIKIKYRKNISILINNIIKKIEKKIKIKKITIENNLINYKISKEKIDVSLPGRNLKIGSLHPINKTINIIKNFFFKFGFSFKSGPEIENKYYNFDALNIDENHPSRNYKDSFWFDANNLLRTHTSSVQIRELKKKKLPIKMISSGKVYRNDTDSTHSPMFHQLECLCIDKNINFSNLKWFVYNFLYYFFDYNIKIRFRSSYFPFTVLSAEIDIMMNNNKWLEILGCGLVHPKILKKHDINTDIYSGFALGVGIERLIMLRYSLKNIKLFFDNDIRFLKQFN